MFPKVACTKHENKYIENTLKIILVTYPDKLQGE